MLIPNPNLWTPLNPKKGPSVQNWSIQCITHYVSVCLSGCLYVCMYICVIMYLYLDGNPWEPINDICLTSMFRTSIYSVYVCFANLCSNYSINVPSMFHWCKLHSMYVPSMFHVCHLCSIHASNPAILPYMIPNPFLPDFEEVRDFATFLVRGLVRVTLG